MLPWLPGNEDSMYRELEGWFLLRQLNEEFSNQGNMSETVSGPSAVQLVPLQEREREHLGTQRETRAELEYTLSP